MQESTRTDLSYDNLNLSMKCKSAKVIDLNKTNKVIRKAHEGAKESKVMLKRTDDYINLEIHAYADTLFKTQDEKTRSFKERILFLINGKKASPLMWKSIKISKVLQEFLYSTKQVERKSLRHMIQNLKDSVSRGEVEEFKWVDTKNMLTDVLTKESAISDQSCDWKNWSCWHKQRKKEISGGSLWYLSKASNQLRPKSK